MLHGSLGTARIAVRRNALAGEGSRKLHGLLDNFKNFSRNCQAGPVDTPGRHQKVFELCCPSVQFPPGPCPACVCGERLSERYRELLCGSFQRATVRAWPSLRYRETPNGPQAEKLGTTGLRFPPCPPAMTSGMKSIGKLKYVSNSTQLADTSAQPSTTCCLIGLCKTYRSKNYVTDSISIT